MKKLCGYHLASAVAACFGIPCFGQVAVESPGAAAAVVRANLPCGVSVCDPVTTFGVDPALKTACLLVEFPHTAWRICLEMKPVKSLWLRQVEFRRPGETTWTPVIKQAGMVDIFVRYNERDPACGPDPCDPARLYDLNPFATNDVIDRADVGVGGLTITPRNETRPLIGVECRDAGLAWLVKRPPVGVSKRYRAKEIVVWAVSDSGNYDAIIQYTFREDGGIEFRYGATGFNGCTSFTTHAHTGLWCVDVDVAGAADDCAMESFREDPTTVAACPGSPYLAAEVEQLFNGGVEGSLDHDPWKFTELLIEDTLIANKHGNPVGLAFVPYMVGGQPRHLGPDERWTQHNFYVTKYKAAEEGYTSPDNWQQRLINPDNYLINKFIADQEGVCGEDVVVWCVAGAVHVPTDEDRIATDIGPVASGATILHWSGFNLHPHNFFDYNPLGDSSIVP